MMQYVDGQWVPVELIEHDFGKWSPACELNYVIGSGAEIAKPLHIRTQAELEATHTNLRKLIDERLAELGEQ